jgi:hypothetical protein
MANDITFVTHISSWLCEVDNPALQHAFQTKFERDLELVLATDDWWAVKDLNFRPMD